MRNECSLHALVNSTTLGSFNFSLFCTRIYANKTENDILCLRLRMQHKPTDLDMTSHEYGGSFLLETHVLSFSSLSGGRDMLDDLAKNSGGPAALNKDAQMKLFWRQSFPHSLATLHFRNFDFANPYTKWLVRGGRWSWLLGVSCIQLHLQVTNHYRKKQRKISLCRTTRCCMVVGQTIKTRHPYKLNHGTNNLKAPGSLILFVCHVLWPLRKDVSSSTTPWISHLPTGNTRLASSLQRCGSRHSFLRVLLTLL